MSRRVYIALLGLGKEIKKEPDAEYQYDKGKYTLDNAESSETRYVQSAVFELTRANPFDAIYLAGTEKAMKHHFDVLSAEIVAKGGPQPHQIIISDSNSPGDFWQWLYTLIGHIHNQDDLSFDLTHGWRMQSLVFSVGINFIRRVRDVRIAAVYYGMFENGKSTNRIVNIVDFYAINEWADAIGRVVSMADTRKLAEMVSTAPGHQFGHLADPTLVDALKQLGLCLTNINVNQVATVADQALAVVKERMVGATQAERLLLESVIEAFDELAGKQGEQGYDATYYDLQQAIIKLLGKYGYYMQAFTVMRECIGSLGLTWVESTNDRKYAEILCNMLYYSQKKWRFNEDQKEYVEKLLPMKQVIEEKWSTLSSLFRELADIRNGFDHAWTSTTMPPDITAKAQDIIENFGKIFPSIADIVCEHRQG